MKTEWLHVREICTYSWWMVPNGLWHQIRTSTNNRDTDKLLITKEAYCVVPKKYPPPTPTKGTFTLDPPGWVPSGKDNCVEKKSCRAIFLCGR